MVVEQAGVLWLTDLGALAVAGLGGLLLLWAEYGPLGRRADLPPRAVRRPISLAARRRAARAPRRPAA